MKLKIPEGLAGKEKSTWESFGIKKGEIVQPEGMSPEDGRKWRYQIYIKDNLACVKSVDDNLGRVLKYLDDNNMTQNTMIIVTSD